MNKKNITRILIVLIVAGAAVFAVRHFTTPKVEEGAKTVEVRIEVEKESGGTELIDSFYLTTSAETVAELLETIDAAGMHKITLSGSKDDVYGRTLIGIDDYVMPDWTSGPWWLYNSETNETCVAAGYCDGIDLNPIYDGDVFTFRFTSTY